MLTYREVAVLTHRDQVPEVLQHHVLVQVYLGGVQQRQLFLGEDHSHVLEGHSFLKLQAHATFIICTNDPWKKSHVGSFCASH